MNGSYVVIEAHKFGCGVKPGLVSKVCAM